MSLNLEITDFDIQQLQINEGLIFDDDRKKVLQSLESIDIQACPGSGKTTLIAAKLILLAKKWPYRRQGICVLSHTNVAKNEIIKKLKESRCLESRKLLSYPHFIGTIQDFVDRYLALPLLKTRNMRCNFFDEGEYHHSAFKVNWPTGMFCGKRQNLLRVFHSKKINFGSFYYCYNLETKELEINPDFIKKFYQYIDEDSFPQKKLLQKKEQLSSQDLFLYRDMYALSEQLLDQNDHMKITIRKRFSLVFIDEMQDTQRYQDELLQKIFPLESTDVALQRFGDPDQAIYNSDADINESYNKKSQAQMFKIINTSHRFSSSISQKIRGLSFNEVNINSKLPDHQFIHTIIVYNDKTIGGVLCEFAKIVKNQFGKTFSTALVVKAIGAAGKKADIRASAKKADAGARIVNYYEKFDMRRSSKLFKPKFFIEAIFFINEKKESDFKDSFKLVVECVLTFLRKANVKNKTNNKYYDGMDLINHLKSKDCLKNFRRLIYDIINNKAPLSKEWWEINVCKLKIILGVGFLNEESSEFMKFIDQSMSKKEEMNQSVTNILEIEGVKIELSTIHGVKGETHDATLVLETKNHKSDLQTMIPYLTGEYPNEAHRNDLLKVNPTSKKPNQVFMRQLYVAMSRPKHLLCLAIHRNGLTCEHETQLNDFGWNICDLSDSFLSHHPMSIEDLRGEFDPILVLNDD